MSQLHVSVNTAEVKQKMWLLGLINFVSDIFSHS